MAVTSASFGVSSTSLTSFPSQSIYVSSVYHTTSNGYPSIFLISRRSYLISSRLPFSPSIPFSTAAIAPSDKLCSSTWEYCFSSIVTGISYVWMPSSATSDTHFAPSPYGFLSMQLSTIFSAAASFIHKAKARMTQTATTPQHTDSFFITYSFCLRRIFPAGSSALKSLFTASLYRILSGFLCIASSLS